MKKIFIILAIAITFCSCEKMEMLFNNTCTIENAIPIEQMFDNEILTNAISSSTQIVIYETSANIENEKYLVRETSYPLSYGETKKIVLDSRTKFIVVSLSTKVVSISGGNRTDTVVGKQTTFIPVEKNVYVKLNKNIFIDY